MNIYYDPEDFGLKVVCSVDWYDEPYMFDMTVLWSDLDSGRFYIGSDSGCSCPSPFEEHSLKNITEITGLTDLIMYLDKHLEHRDPEDYQINRSNIISAYTKARGGLNASLYRKKPVEIEAVRFNTNNGREVAKWCGGRFSTKFGEHPLDVYEAITIPTLEGDMVARLGDYIIRGVQGEYYPCKPDIFEQTYERV